MKLLLIFCLAISTGYGDLIATFRTTAGDFQARLDFQNAPVATANFVSLAGAEEETWVTDVGVVSPFGVPFRPTAPQSFRPILQVTRGQGRVQNPSAPVIYDIRVGPDLIASVGETTITGGFIELDGGRFFQLSQIGVNGPQWEIRMRSPRPWLNPLTQQIEDGPMYRNIPFHRYEEDVAVYSGTFGGRPGETAGYQFQDEIVRGVNFQQPYGSSFIGGGILAMESTGPNTNSSGFFLTVSGDNNRWLGRNTPFGALASDSDFRFIRDLSRADADEEGRPVEPVTITNIEITRTSIAAGAFFAPIYLRRMPQEIQRLPVSLNNSDLPWTLEAGNFLARRPIPLGKVVHILQSDDLRFQAVEESRHRLPTDPGGFMIQVNPDVRKRFWTAIGSSFLPTFNAQIGLYNPRWPSLDPRLAGRSYAFRIDPNGNPRDLVVTFGTQFRTVSFINPNDNIEVRANMLYDASGGPYEGRITLQNVDNRQGSLDFDELIIHLDGNPRFREAQGQPSTRRFSTRQTDDDSVPSLEGIFIRIQ